MSGRRPWFRHVILTRFNLATSGRESKLRNNPDWLSHRFDLFERYCLPSVCGQTTQDFDWLIFFDDQTPEEFRSRVKDAQSMQPFHSIYSPLFPSDGWRNAALDCVSSDPREALLTSTLDNDDGIAQDYVQRLHSAVGKFTGDKPLAFNFLNGLIVSDKKLYLHQHPSSAFRNIIEPYGASLCTAAAVPHMDIVDRYDVIQI